MKKALGFASKILFFAMIGVLLVLNASYTMSFVGRLFPEDWIKQWGSLVIFDVGAICWFLVFLTWAEGAGQRGVSLLMGAVDLVGSLIIAGAEVFGAADSYMTDHSTLAFLQQTATWILFIWLGINIAMTWVYHVVAPKQQEEMRARNIQDDTVAKALDMAEAKVNQVATLLADELSDGMYTDILARLNITNRSLLPARKSLPARPTQDVIDAEFEEDEKKEEKPKQKKRSANPQLRRVASYAYETVTPEPGKGRGATAGPILSDEPDNIVTTQNGKVKQDPTGRA